MSALLRDACRELLLILDAYGYDLVAGSPFHHIRQLIAAEERAEAPPEPAVLQAFEVERAQLVEALRQFRKISGHFVGCPADKDGQTCSAACAIAQAALDPRRVGHARTVVDVQQATIRALENDARSLRQTVVKHEAALGLVKRPRGRPRKQMAKADARSPGTDNAITS